jgi:hypothetical protein
MSEEKEVGFFGQLKNQIITGAGVILTTLGTIFIDEIKSIVGIEDETEQVQGAQQSNQQQQNVVINIPEQKATETKTVIIKEGAAATPAAKPTPPKKTDTEKRKEEGLDW